ncbi:hypothetical protein P691DRAFT_169538 [Macrolepiota fuliginosa MF-IS2]|uniref:Uncharacterized protein n=1 Tax=Macrolepiota fuliginosa MF-IS2 TaxID=1400762 RepID=A0A9P5X4K4_9AGAR|nr:hypothetical protein P691DRAFT_374905 [Macrolepiota fuliginosa MF-IS2]KAF9446679.1 hypothetical protein P691DRAFT_169538 [Macrolepiota fuliginosa MF-IS2]
MNPQACDPPPNQLYNYSPRNHMSTPAHVPYQSIPSHQASRLPGAVCRIFFITDRMHICPLTLVAVHKYQ